jgi:D-arabinose 1-dehydrogenase-like Zn-dependent alcohol dehydrogenase
MMGSIRGRTPSPHLLNTIVEAGMKFSDKVVFVTGAAQGMGLAIVQRFAAEGASVVAADINGEAAARPSPGWASAAWR